MIIFATIGDVLCSIIMAAAQALTSIFMILSKMIIAILDVAVQFCLSLPFEVLGGIVAVFGFVWSMLTFRV